MDHTVSDSDKPLHVVMFPWLAMGHVYPCFEVCKILAQKGHYATLVSTPKIIDRLPKLPQTLTPFVKLTKLPLSPHIDQNHLPQDADSTMDIPSNKLYYLKSAYDALQQPMAQLLKTSNPDWVFYDFAASWIPELAKSLHIHSAYFSPCPAWSICFFDTPKQQLGEAADNRPNPEDYYGPPKWVPFPTNIGLRPYEVRKLLEDVKVNETGASPVFDLNEANSGCDMFVIRSSRDLEQEWLDYVAEFYHKPVVPVGLLPPMQVTDSEEGDNSPDWLQIKAWLETQKASSVVYIAFGSEVKLSQENLNELALGIELSGLPFFWALRKGSVELLPDGFEDRTKDRGVVWKTWAPQPKILAHTSVGGCLTHCGSGSMIENLYFGHVLVMLPFLLDQALYSRVMEEKKVGIEIPRNPQDGSFTRTSVAKALKLAMVDDEGSAYRKNAKEMGEKFSNKDLHNQYIEDFIVSLQNSGIGINRK
ncbi:soyasaponin III rhamnosyltransferase-like [Vigna unguiculata]|uniref:UDP-glucosyl transferase 73C n=1 Tax=Vigna unguiculata TaxID=3917 RepID=A0A4D6KLK6_VIGUN|nr:soyasaponin III rhamnosyltransferase-like [Vigna unguiculata]QCD76527.1 UDP-glucosyl transferase 73C [Vigna unguiculata]